MEWPAADGPVLILHFESERMPSADVRRIFEGLDARLVTVSSLAEATRVAADTRPSLILLWGPSPGRHESIRQIKAQAELAAIPILLIDPSVAKSGTEEIAQVDGYLIEPVQPAEWQTVVRTLLRLGRMEAAGQATDMALAQVDRHLQDATETTGCGIWDWDIPSGTLCWYGAHERLAGMGPGAFSGKIEAFSDVVHPDDRARVWERLTTLMVKRETLYADEYRFVHPDGTVRDMAGTGRFTYDPMGQPVRMTGIVRDVTDEKQSQERLRFETRRARLLAEAAEYLLTSDDPKTLMVQVFDTVRQELGLDGFFHYRLDDAAGHLVLQSCTGIPPELVQDFDRLALGQALCGLTAQMGEPVIRERVQHSQDVEAEAVKALGFRAYACHPLKVGDRVLGTLSFVSRTREHFTSDDLAFMQTICRYTAAVQERLRLQTELAVRARQLAEREEALRASEASLRRFLDTAASGLVRVNREFTFVSVNEAYTRLIGRRADQILGRSLMEVLGEEAVALIRPYAERALRGERVQYEALFPLPNVGRRWLQKIYTPERDEAGAVTGWVASILDLTEQKKAQADRQMLSSLVEQSTEFIGICDLQFRPIFVSPAGMRLVGLDSLEDACRVEVKQYFFPEDQVFIYQEFFPRVLRDGRGEVEIRFRHFKTGEPLWMLYDVFYLRGTDGEPIGLATFSRHITERKKTELQLRESEAQYRATFNNAAIGIAHVALDGRWNRFNDAACAITGYSRDELERLTFMDITHPDDIEPDWAQARRLLSGEISTYSMEKRYLRKDSSVVWVCLTVSLLRDSESTPINFIAVIENVDQRKRAEGALREQERLLRTVTSAAQVGLVVVGPGYIYRFANEAYLEILGLGPEESVIGRSVSDLIGAGWQHIQPRLDRAFAGEHVTFEITLPGRRPDEGPRHFGAFYEPHRDQNGEQTVVAVVVDLTDRKRAEETIRQNESRLRLALTSGRMGAWDVDLVTGETNWDAQEYTLLGLDPEAAPASWKEFRRHVHPDDIEPLKDAVGQAIAGSGELDHEFRIQEPEGEIRWLVSKGVVLKDEAGAPRRMVGINYDVTEWKAAEARLRSFSQELERQVEVRTHELVQSQQRLRALTAELNLAEMRERKRLAAELHDHLQQMLVLGKIKLGAGKRETASMPDVAKLIYEVDNVLSAALDYTRTLVAELSPPVLRHDGLTAGLRWLVDYMKKYEMSVSFTSEGPEVQLPEGQSVLLFQSVRELLINSSKHAGTGEADIVLSRTDEMVTIVASDHGAGFDPSRFGEEIPDASLTSKFGLFSIQERMRAMGGSFRIQSAPGRGTTTTLTLPLVGREYAKPVRMKRRASEHNEGHHAGPSEADVPARIRVLLVDDHAMVRQGIRSLLEQFEDIDLVGEAVNGEDAVTWTERLRPAVVLMDINMPKMNGIEATTRIKELVPGIHIIGLSVNADGEHVEEMMAAGAAQLITKEAAVDTLYEAIHSVMRMGRRLPD